MNTHDIDFELPPLPEWADTTLQGEDRDSLFAWAEAAIEADRKTTEKQLAAYRRLVNSLESRLTDLQAKHDELKKSTNPDLLASERAANAILTEELEADRKRRGEPVYQVNMKGNGWEDCSVDRHESAGRAMEQDAQKGWKRWDRRVLWTAPQPVEPSRGEPVAWQEAVEAAKADALTVFADSCNHTKEGIEYMTAALIHTHAPQSAESVAWPLASKEEADIGWTLDYCFLEQVEKVASQRTDYTTSMEATEQVLIAAAEVLGAPQPAEPVKVPRLYQHDDGRYGLSFGPARFTEGNPAWHRLPIDIIETPEES